MIAGWSRPADLAALAPSVYRLAHADLLAAAETLLAAFGAGHGDAENQHRLDTANPSSRHEENTR